jgi:hypothetical protein
MRRTFLALGITMVAMWGATASAGAVAEPTLTLHEFCQPYPDGQPRYGLLVEASGLVPSGLYDIVWDFGHRQGGASDVVSQADANGNIVFSEPVSTNMRVHRITVDLRYLSSNDQPTVASATLKKPCRHAAQPQLTLEEYCQNPGAPGEWYGFSATASGLVPGASYDIVYQFQSPQSAMYFTTGRADENGDRQFAGGITDQPVKEVTVLLRRLLAPETRELLLDQPIVDEARLKMPCKR